MEAMPRKASRIALVLGIGAAMELQLPRPTSPEGDVLTAPEFLPLALGRRTAFSVYVRSGGRIHLELNLSLVDQCASARSAREQIIEQIEENITAAGDVLDYVKNASLGVPGRLDWFHWSHHDWSHFWSAHGHRRATAADATNATSPAPTPAGNATSRCEEQFLSLIHI